jgi:hypothetical protein
MPEPAKAKPKREYLHVLMAVHPLHGKPIPLDTFTSEEAAYQAAAIRNKTHSHLAHHVKRVAKGQST